MSCVSMELPAATQADSVYPGRDGGFSKMLTSPLIMPLDPGILQDFLLINRCAFDLKHHYHAIELGLYSMPH